MVRCIGNEYGVVLCKIVEFVRVFFPPPDEVKVLKIGYRTFHKSENYASEELINSYLQLISGKVIWQ